MPCFQNPPRDFIDLVWAINENHPGINWDLFAITIQSLWNNKNIVRHGGQRKGHEVIVREVVEYMKEVQLVKQPQKRPPPQTNPIGPPKIGMVQS